MDGRRLWKRIQRVWITLGITFTVVFVGWSLIAYRSSAEARAATRPDDAVSVMHGDGIWHFLPRQARRPPRTALVFFAGALVDPVAYAPLARAVAAAGYPTHIVELPRRGAFGGAEDPELWARVERVVSGATAPRQWMAAGHSRGGVVASQLATERRPGFAGLVLIGTSHPRDVDLSALTVPVTKIVGTRDGLASRGEVEANARLLPPATRWVWIEGGNHSQFGWYGFQPGDSRATIGAPEQRALMMRAVVDALAAVDTVGGSSPR
jgi:pimeloyl-ACP methyl ester carboxylesterase